MRSLAARSGAPGCVGTSTRTGGGARAATPVPGESVRHSSPPVGVARSAGCRRVWLMTTNDNLGALRFYQRRGFRLAGLRPGALAASRALKPEIPETGASRARCSTR